MTRSWGRLGLVSPAMLIAGVIGLVTSGAGAASVAPGYLLRDVQASRYTGDTDTDCVPGHTTLTCFQLDTETEPSISVNPENPLNAVAVFQQGRRDDGGAAVNGYTTTFDGGKTWTAGNLPGITKLTGGPFDRASDPVVAFGPGNVVYAQSLLLNFSGGRRALWNNVSRDGGRTWEPAEQSIVADDTYGGTDKNWFSVDLGTGPGHHTGRIYTVWDRIAPVSVAYSDDEGATWHVQDLGFVVYPGQGIGALPLVLKDGSLAVLWSTLAYPLPPKHPSATDTIGQAAAGLTRFVIAIAPAAGQMPTGAPLVFTPPVTVAVYLGRPVMGQRAGDGIPAAIVDPDSGSIYVVWNDARFRSDERNDIVITRSDDNGLTWTPPVAVDPGPRDNFVNLFLPMIGVGPDGDVRVAYRRRHENDLNHAKFFSQQVDTLYQVSTDRGATFSTPLKVNTTQSHLGYAVRSRGGAFLGDYHQLAVAGEWTYIVHTEPVRVSPREAFTFPPSFHHQRTWVSVVTADPADVAPPKKPVVLGGREERDLPRTGVPAVPGALALLGAMGLAASWLRRGR